MDFEALLNYLIKHKETVIPVFLVFSLFYMIVDAMGYKMMTDIVLCKKSHKLARTHMSIDLFKSALEILTYFGLSVISKKFDGIIAKRENDYKILFDKVANTDVEIAVDIYVMRYHLLCQFIFFLIGVKILNIKICYSGVYYPSEPMLYQIYKVQVMLKKILDYFNLDMTINLTDYQICMFLDFCIYCQIFGAIFLIGWIIAGILPVSVYRALTRGF